MKRLLKKSIAMATAVSITVTGFTGLPAALAATEVKLSSNLAEYTKQIQVTSGGNSWQWYVSQDAAGTSAKEIEGANEASYIPMEDTVGSWIYCMVNGAEKSDPVRVVASSSIQMEKIYKDTSSNSEVSGNFTYCNLGNTEQANYPGTVLTTDWAVGGTVEVEYKGIDDSGSANENIPALRLNTWGETGYSPANVSAAVVENQQNGSWKAVYKYEDMLNAWNGDRDFKSVFALQAYRTGTDTSWSVASAKYVGPTFDTKQVPAPDVKLSADYAVYGQAISAEITGMEGNSWQWYISERASGTGSEPISEAVSQSFTPQTSQIGGWLFCEVNGYRSEPIRVLASEEYDKMKIDYINDPKQFAEDSNYVNLQNTAGNGGMVDTSKWAVGGRIIIEYSGLTEAGNVEALPLLRLNTWSTEDSPVPDDYKAQSVQGSSSRMLENGHVEVQYDYNDMLAAWYGDKDFSYIKALQAQYSGSDKTSVVIERVTYVGPPLSFGDTLERISMRGTSPTNQYLFTAHVGGTEFDATRIREDSYFYVEYTGTEDAIVLIAQSHSDGDSNGSTYATINASEYGKTGSGQYSKFTAEAIKEQFGNRFRMIDGIRINKKEAADKIETTPVLYFYEGNGPLVDDIKADGYERAVDVPWTKYDDTDKDGIVVIGASISQNPLVTPAALEGHPYYEANGGWNAVLDRTDVVTYGIGSQTTSDIAARFHEILKYDYKKIIMQCGNNDLGAFTGDDAPENAAEHEFKNYCSMMDQVAAKNEKLREMGKPEIEVYIIAINNVNSETTNKKIQAVIQKLNTLEDKYSFVTYIEQINAEFRDPNGSVYDPSYEHLVMDDGLHPVAEGYAIYARYLKPLLDSKDPTDSGLISLSWRADDNSRNYTIDGFESGDSGNREYSMQLSAGAPDTVRLYMTPGNLNAEVQVLQGIIKEDSYGNSYVDVDMSSGSQTVEIQVTSEDGSRTSTFKVNLTAKDKSVLFSAEDAQFDLNDDFAETEYFPYVQYSADVANSDMVLSFDVEVENMDFTQIWVKGSYDWNDPDQGLWLQADDFQNYVYHVERPLEGIENISNVIISLGGSNIDYRGGVAIRNIEVRQAPQSE